MNGARIKSVMVCEHDKIIYETDRDLTITVNKEKLHAPLKSEYPAQITIQIHHKDFPFELVLNCEALIESKDLLGGVNPLIARLIKSFVARPAYYGIYSTAKLKTPNHEFDGFGIYEFMLFRKQ